MSEGLCWCASENKCPHGISHKLPEQWDSIEEIIDEVLQQYDRRSIKKFLKRDADGNVKPNISEHMKGESTSGNSLGDSSKPSTSAGRGNSTSIK